MFGALLRLGLSSELCVSPMQLGALRRQQSDHCIHRVKFVSPSLWPRQLAFSPPTRACGRFVMYVCLSLLLVLLCFM